jgi:hypothetical protein
MSGTRRERPEDETSPRQGAWDGIWEALACAITPESGGQPVGSAPDGEATTVERMRELLGSDTPPERPGH